MRTTETFGSIEALAILRRVERRRLIATLVGCCTVWPAAAAQAQNDPGVKVDPGSPSAKEYGIPLEDARRKADPSRKESDPVVQGSRDAPLFGEGVTSGGGQQGSAGGGSAGGGSTGSGSAGGAGSAGGGSGEDSSASGGTGSEKRRGSSAEDRRSAGAAQSRRAPAAVVEAAAQPGAPAGGSSTALFVGIGALILALGALGGVLLRRRTGP